MLTWWKGQHTLEPGYTAPKACPCCGENPAETMCESWRVPLLKKNLQAIWRVLLRLAYQNLDTILRKDLMLSDHLYNNFPYCRLDTGAHFYDTYETKDGRYMAVGALEPQFYDELIRLLGLDSDEVGQSDDFESMKKVLQEKFKGKTQKEWAKVRILNTVLQTSLWCGYLSQNMSRSFISNKVKRKVECVRYERMAFLTVIEKVLGWTSID